MLELTILNHNWGSLRLAQHKSYTRENRCTDLCHDVCVMYATIRRLRVHHAYVHTHYEIDMVKITVSADRVLNVAHQQLKGSGRSNNEIKRKLENEEVAWAIGTPE